MNSTKQKNKRMERAAADLIGAARLTESEIDKIASAPQLFASIRTRIAEERIAGTVTNAVPARPSLQSAFAFAAVLIAVVSAAAFLISRREVPQQAAVLQPAALSLAIENPREEQKYTVSREPDREVTTTIAHPPVERAIVREFVPKQPARKNGRKRPVVPAKDLEFYALNSAAYETRDGRIVRVSLPRASLVALGANISLEGDGQNVTADLLVGADGVPRAIRVVQ